LDGEHLASGSRDGSIRIWHAESFHTKSSRTQIERPTRAPKQADAILVGSDLSSTALSFSRTDSNILASGGYNGYVKLWNITEQACIHSFNPGRGQIRSLIFAGGADIACVALTGTGSIIRFWKAEGSSDFASETIGEVDPAELHLAACSPSGSFLATSFGLRTGIGSAVTLYDLETMTKTQSVVMPGFLASYIAVAPDSKQLVVSDYRGVLRLLQTDDLSNQRDLYPTGAVTYLSSVAFDPSCRVLAIGCDDGTLELQSL
jgi:WD40 repeat protein